mgnify:FL=1
MSSMRCKVQIDQKHIKGALRIPGSKSISNRLLIIQALQAVNVSLQNGSNSKDTLALQNALRSNSLVKDIGLAGTAMRFLTAFYAIQNTEIVLTGAARMKERPINDLVEALRVLGADITYLEKEGFPPLQIRGKTLSGGCLSIKASISSQFISAILLIAPYLKKGIQLELIGEVLSKPYIEMTLSLMKQQGVNSTWIGNKISVLPGVYSNQITEVESDWSSISYLFEVLALSDSGEISVSQVLENSTQGDSIIMELYQSFGIRSRIDNKVLTLRKIPGFELPKFLEFDCKATPDLAQTIAVTACGLGVCVKITGLFNLPLKETDRLQALQNELVKCGAEVLITNNHTLHIDPLSVFPCIDLEFKTYQDHRMAMSLAPLALKAKSVLIHNSEVVNKSYKSYWEDLQKLSFNLILH